MGANILEVIDDLKMSLKPSFYEKYDKTSFCFRVRDYGVRYSQKEKIEIIDSFGFLPLNGPISLDNPSLQLNIHINFENNHHYFSRKIATGSREIISSFSLKKRKYLGTTSMDAELAMFMCNLALVRKGSIVYDPFVGTGSILCASSYFGAFTIGSDIDGRQMRGKGSNGSGGSGGSGGDSLLSNVQQYRQSELFIGSLVFDFLHHPLSERFEVDCIISDPPYGVRAGAKKIGRKFNDRKCVILSMEEKSLNYPMTIPYEMDELTKDLHIFSGKHLKKGGRLVYWYPAEFDFANDEKRRLSIEEIKKTQMTTSRENGLFLVSMIPQMCRHFDRWLIVMERGDHQ